MNQYGGGNFGLPSPLQRPTGASNPLMMSLGGMKPLVPNTGTAPQDYYVPHPSQNGFQGRGQNPLPSPFLANSGYKNELYLRSSQLQEKGMTNGVGRENQPHLQANGNFAGYEHQYPHASQTNPQMLMNRETPTSNWDQGGGMMANGYGTASNQQGMTASFARQNNRNNGMGFGYMADQSGAFNGAPGPRAIPGNVNGETYPRHQEMIHPESYQYKPFSPQSPSEYGHAHTPVHSIGDIHDPLSMYRAGHGAMDIENQSRGKLGYSPKPKRDYDGGGLRREPQTTQGNIVKSELTFENNPHMKRAPPKPILKSSENRRFTQGHRSIRFNNDVMVHEVESWKIYNVDMGKEAKKNFKRESQQECTLI